VQFEGTEVQQAVAAAARKFATERAEPAAARADREARFPEELVRELGQLGLLGVNVPAAFGGSEAGVVAYAMAVMEVARADCSLAVTMAVTNMVGETIVRFGTEPQKARCLPRLASAEWLAGAFGLSEPEAGSDPNSMTTRADKRGGHWVLNGTKQWITSGDRAGVIIVWARTDVGAGNKGITAFLVEGGTPGLQVGRHEEKMGIRSSSTVSLTFDDCRIPIDAVLGEGGTGSGWRWPPSTAGASGSPPRPPGPSGRRWMPPPATPSTGRPSERPSRASSRSPSRSPTSVPRTTPPA
jgi:alkylation response protein AidB-like acyl-CoA dehydrogenase